VTVDPASERPLSETAKRFSACMADAFPGRSQCGDPTTTLLVLTCDAQHWRWVSVCDDHAAVAAELAEPGAIGTCALCEDLTGTDEPMTVATVEP
jgi:hypothetical protein